MTDQTNPFTLRSVAGAPSDPVPLSRATLLLIDVQAEYEPGGGLALPNHGAAMRNISALLTTARTEGSNVIHVAHRGTSEGLFDPDAGGRISTAAHPARNEITIHKSLPSAFAGTDLHQQLQARNTTHLVLAGFMTHMCISSTARAALDLGYATTVIADATATRSLPSPTHGPPVDSQMIHDASLAALADRFSIVTTTGKLQGARLSGAHV